MKKLLSLLSVLTISGTAVPTTIAASSYQKEEKLNSDINYQQTNNLKRSKRATKVRNEIEASKDDIFPSFMPDLWEEIKEKYNYYSYLSDFQEWFKNRMNDGVWQDNRIKNRDLKGIAKNIWNNWSTYNSLWENSSKNQRIRIKIAWDNNYSYRSANIRTDDYRNEIEFEYGFLGQVNGICYMSFLPNLWLELKSYHDDNYQGRGSYSNYEKLFVEKIFNGVWMDVRISKSIVKGLAKGIWDNWDSIVSYWDNSDKKHRIRIVFRIIDKESLQSAARRDFRDHNLIAGTIYRSTNIRTDELITG